ncbi:MAG: hypothetical protein GEV05_06910 [Betaproteobacteria bacterium]|nr:hypothetical protein [Betaproteobacteria bacterium]
MSNEARKLDDFSLLGGPLHRLGQRLGLVRGGSNTVPLGLALGVSCWSILLLLAAIEGIVDQVFSLSVIGGHVRLLVAIPLFFWCESLLDPRMAVFVHTIVRSGVVPDTVLPAFDAELARIRRWKDSWLPESVCLLAAVVMSTIAPVLPLLGSTATGPVASEPGLTAQWYWLVCLTLFRFLVLRWLWRICLWSYFLWRVARLELHLVPTHPDGAGGLGYLEVVHSEFALLIVALSSLQAAMLAESVVSGTTTPTAIYPAIAFVLVIEAAMFLGPMFVFAPQLWLCRVKGLDTYMQLAARYVNEFERKWLGAAAIRPDELLGTGDVQSMADFATSVGIVRDMRLIPVSQRLLVTFVASAVLPLLPLVLLFFPTDELAQRLLKMLFGL